MFTFPTIFSVIHITLCSSLHVQVNINFSCVCQWVAINMEYHVCFNSYNAVYSYIYVGEQETSIHLINPIKNTNFKSMAKTDP